MIGRLLAMLETFCRLKPGQCQSIGLTVWEAIKKLILRS